MNNSKQFRQVAEMITASPASDGDGVKLMRVFGGRNLARFDPFLMLDEFGSDEARDYIGGFPAHPHRGFETVTYMLEGKMEHRDHMDNVGILEHGDVQWMKAGSGVIHSEMPMQEEGRMRGFQLWVNLPAAEKMTPAAYNDIPSSDIPKYQVGNSTIRAIAGTFTINDVAIKGAVTDKSTNPGYLDIETGKAPQELIVAVNDGDTALLYVYEGEIALGSPATKVNSQQMVRLNGTGDIIIGSHEGSRMLLITGTPIGEPIEHYGPFVMNTMAEIETAIQDYQQGRLVNQEKQH